MAFKVKSTDYYLKMGIPPCKDCECTQSIKQGLKSCPYLDSPFLTRVFRAKFDKNTKEWVSASPYTFVDFPYLHLINSTFERVAFDDDTWEILIK